MKRVRVINDARVSPVVGNEIFRRIPQAKNEIILRYVTRSHGGFVFFEQDNGYVRKSKIVTLKDWQKWASKSEVLAWE